MKSILALGVVLAFSAFAQESQAQFLFPRLAAVRLNAQARALDAQAIRNNAAVNSQLAAQGAFVQRQVVVNNVVPVQSAFVVARPQVVFFNPAPAFVVPSSPVFTGGVSVSASVGSHCGF